MSYELLHVKRRDSEGKPEDKHYALKKLLDKMAYFVAVLGPLSSADQAIQIWTKKSAEGVSIIVWSVLFLSAIFWLIYSTVHKERAIFFGHVIWLILSSIIIFEIIIFS